MVRLKDEWHGVVCKVPRCLDFCFRAFWWRFTVRGVAQHGFSYRMGNIITILKIMIYLFTD